MTGQRWIGKAEEKEVLKREHERDEGDVEEKEIKTWFKCSLSFSFRVCFASTGMLLSSYEAWFYLYECF